MSAWNLPKAIEIKEVGTRDGFQLEKSIIPTDEKVRIINALSRTGIKEIQVTSAVHPKAVPQLADAEEVMAKIDRVPGVLYSVLVPNLRGANRALAMEADEWELMLSVTESHSIANSNRSVDAVLEEHTKVVDLAVANGVQVRGSMATTFGCPFEGRVPFERVQYVVQAYYDMGVRSISAADTIGVADPKLVFNTMSKLIHQFPDVQFNLHLHNTRQMGLANVIAGIQAGVRSFDSSIGGLGGCPYAPGATGNISTEDTVHMLHLMGIETTIDLAKVLDVTKEVHQLVHHDLESSIYRAGVSYQIHEAPKTQEKVGE
ncbi:hydroxymethylglutaryl-CoA lyase [Caldibacillus lycopersici]|uniref:Hydroxymethylglutaryl-CoA lyase n=1 Tax=Perspicuibacillus lycopersici TaxID=1325689 RepID=A0AAE3IQP0_9BACI|nr:hydroxymethylglutaryl-CoA lyase [Perspicuibacillus lycopersici]MCU9612646.1 hydroxymethylglutaryl-CoA lyase [Perspicuibacillus lycopersici]